MKPIIFVADVHLGVFETDRIDYFVEFLQNMAPKAHKIHIMGDLFNFWVGNAQAGIPSFKNLLDTLKSLSLQKKITFLCGNRDFLFIPYFRKRLRGQVFTDGTELLLGNTKLLLYHGDSLCPDDIGYQRMKRILQSELIYSLSCGVSTPMCVSIGNMFRSASRKAKKHKASDEMGLSNKYMKQILEERHADAIICGHIHQQQIRELGNGKKVYVLPPCDAHEIGYLQWDGELSFRQYHSGDSSI